MNAIEQTDLAARFAHALKVCGLTVERGRTELGQLRYRPAEAEELLGRLMALNYRVTYTITGDGTPQTLGSDPAQCHLRLLDDRRSECVGEEDGGNP